MRLAAIAIALDDSGCIRAGASAACSARSADAGAAAARPLPTAPPVETTSKTKHSIQINGKTLAYTATAGTLILKKDDKPWASMFYVAYTRDDAARTVPNGRLRSPSTAVRDLRRCGCTWERWDPKRVEMGPDGEQPKPPYHLVDNEDTALEFTDLVFIDPVTTGFSRAAPGEKERAIPRLRRRSGIGGRIHPALSDTLRSAGDRPSFWRAKVTAPRDRRRFRNICWTTTESI